MSISSLPPARAARVGFFAALAPLTFVPAVAADPAPSAATTTPAPKTHVLFMGADIAVEKDKAFHRVEDVTATALVIKPDGKPVSVPLTLNVNLRINESLKIAGTNVGLTELKAERAYTPGADPFQKLANAVTLAAGESAVTDLAQGEVMRANTGVMGANIVLNAVRGTPNEGWGRAAVAEATAKQATAEAVVARSFSTPGSEIYDVGSRSVATGVEASQELFDAIRVSFQVTPERDLAQPYYAVIALIRERDSKPGQLRKWAYVKSLGAIRAGVPTKVNVYQSGLPPGYILESCEVHLYDRGEELATSLSRKRVPLTDEETLDFRIIEYVGANKGRTVPALLAASALTADVRGRLAVALVKDACYVRVAKDGRVTAAFRDAAGTQPLPDATLESALKTLRFNPALQAGKPVESIVRLNPDQLAPR